MIKHIFYILSGVVVGGAVIYLIETLGHKIYPLPENLEWTDPEEIGKYIASLPIGALIMVLLGYFLGSMAGGFMTVLYKNSGIRNALAVGIVLLILGIINLVMIQHPTWFVMVSLMLFIPSAYFGGKLGLRVVNK